MKINEFKELTMVHEAIRQHVKEAKEEVALLEKVLAQSSDKWIPEQSTLIDERYFSLKQTLSYLQEGARNHHQREISLLKPLVGDFLMRAIEKECQAITEHLEKVKIALEKIQQMQSSITPGVLLEMAGHAQDEIDLFNKLVENHSQKMDVILEMLGNSD